MKLIRRFTEDSYKREPWFRALCDAILQCKTQEDVSNFLRDIGTLSELQAWSERLEVARLLTQGLSYRDISEKTGASTTTVTRVAKFIENGPGGYRKHFHAHRHHRMMPAPASAVQSEKGPDTPPAPTSVLQKYLDR